MGLTKSSLHFEFQDILGKIMTVGNVFFVGSEVTGSSDTDGRPGRDPVNPFATIDFAVGQCTVSNNDVIFVLPLHVETVVADSGIDVDVVGVSIIGMGRGTDRPTVTFTTAVGADFKLAAANVRVENILFVAGIDALTGPIELSAAYCELVNCEFQDGATGTIDTTDCVIVTAAGDNCLIDGFVYIGNSDAAIQSGIQLTAGAVDPRVMNCYITGSFAVGNIEVQSTTDLVRIGPNNLLINTNATDTCIDVVTTTTGSIFRNMLEIATNGEVTAITVANDASLYENYFVNLDQETGGLQGVASS